MPQFVASVAHRDTGMGEYLIREAASERELRDALSDEGLVVRSLRPAEFGGKGARFEIRTLKGRVAGPFGPDILRAMVRDGNLTPHCSIRKTGDLDTHAWLPAWKAKGLFPGHVVDSIRRSHEVADGDDDETAKLKALKRQLDGGLIDEHDYRFKKGELLGTPYGVEISQAKNGKGHTANGLALISSEHDPAPEVIPARRVVNTTGKGGTMYCSDCGTQLLDRAVICPSCGCPTRNHKSHTSQDADLTPGRIAACYVLGFLFPLGGFIGSIYLFVKGSVGHGIGVILVSLFFMFFWFGFFESLAYQGY